MMSDPIPFNTRLQTGFGGDPRCVDIAFDYVEKNSVPKSKTDREIVVCHESELPRGERKIVNDGKRSIGVFRLEGGFFAILNFCPHMGAELCRGHVGATHRPGKVHEFDPALSGRILHCPWHGWEFDIVTGKGLYDEKGRVPTYPVEVNGEGYVVIRL